MSDVVKLRQPIRKRISAWLKSTREERLGWFALVTIIIAFVDDMRGDTEHGIFMLCLAIIMLLLCKQESS